MSKPKRKFKRRKLFDPGYIRVERRKTRLLLFIILWGIIFTWLVKTYIFSLETVKGVSMHPTYQEGSSFHTVDRVIYRFVSPKRGDVIAIKNIWKKEDELIKRIIAIPGDVIKIKKGSVYLNGELLHEDYVRGKTYPDMGPLSLGENMYFVMGDNREFSYDSRHFGFIKRGEIRGRLQK